MKCIAGLLLPVHLQVVAASCCMVRQREWRGMALQCGMGGGRDVGCSRGSSSFCLLALDRVAACAWARGSMQVAPLLTLCPLAATEGRHVSSAAGDKLGGMGHGIALGLLGQRANGPPGAGGCYSTGYSTCQAGGVGLAHMRLCTKPCLNHPLAHNSHAPYWLLMMCPPLDAVSIKPLAPSAPRLHLPPSHQERRRSSTTRAGLLVGRALWPARPRQPADGA